MDYTVKERTQSKILAEIAHTKDEIEHAKKEAYSNLSKKIKIPGFRLGKAPYEIGSAYIGSERLLEEAFELLLDKSLVEFFEKENIEPFTKPSVDVKEFSHDKIVYEVTVEFLPQIEFDPEKKLEIKRTIEVKESEIEEKLKELQETFTELEPKNSPVENGDIIEVAYRIGDKDEQTITVEVGKDKVVGNFNELVLGKNIGEEFEVETQNTVVKFRVISIKTKKVPEINDDFAKEIGSESLEALREKIKSEIYENKKLQLEENRGREALYEVAKDLNVELPKKYIEGEVESRYKEYETEYLKHGLKLESLLEKEGKTVDQFKEEIKKDVIQELKETLILREIIKKKGLMASKDEIEKEFERILQDEHIEKGSVKMNEEIERYIRNEILKNKAISILKENTIIMFGGE
ncbi:trigger factor [Caldisericum exile]|uniref:Trigger factor n=1 Tax=Caldisericum exile (strain DSM 21853 / NBRC 104410 / AZM16c01) TaxID=511051 RepID=A0A7U6GED9_CALEA|nr:trigger factor [Caldisericum exile]BAL80848.1 trigger factor [Caldisericum exile AZM16c01]